MYLGPGTPVALSRGRFLPALLKSDFSKATENLHHLTATQPRPNCESQS